MRKPKKIYAIFMNGYGLCDDVYILTYDERLDSWWDKTGNTDYQGKAPQGKKPIIEGKSSYLTAVFREKKDAEMFLLGASVALGQMASALNLDHFIKKVQNIRDH